jgi:hypothetical protein
MPSFLTEVETGILSQITTLSTASFSMATAARPAFITGLVIWITLTGYEVAFGKTQDSVAYLLTRFLLVCWHFLPGQALPSCLVV